jgi:DNA-binding CsgD family transcriptional regulator
LCDCIRATVEIGQFAGCRGLWGTRVFILRLRAGPIFYGNEKSISARVKIPSSFKKLTVEIEAACGAKCAWILFDPALTGHQKLWRDGALELVRPAHREGVAEAVRGIPVGGQPATGRADWVRKLVAALVETENNPSGHLVLPIMERSQVRACIGWSRYGDDGNSDLLLTRLSAVRTQVRKAFALEKATTEAKALQWLLARGDRLCVAARADGELLGASLPAREFLQEMRFGPRHFFRSDEPELPPALPPSISQSCVGQVVLNPSCTARFERLSLTGGSWMSVVGIEFFPEHQAHLPLSRHRLTAVERDILGQIAIGKTNREIAQHRGTSFATVKNQISHLLGKVGVARRIGLLVPSASPQSSPTRLEIEGVRSSSGMTR